VFFGYFCGTEYRKNNQKTPSRVKKESWMSFFRGKLLTTQMIDWLLVIFIALATLGYWAGVPSVPFHPDESTCIFMSADWELLFSQPAALAWQPEISNLRQTYHLLDAPLSRYLCGAARWISGQAPLAADWNWAWTWDQNQAAGALPGSALLTASRFGSAFLFPFSLLLLYLTGYRLGGRFLGWSSLILMASSALILLHTRRAMAEGGLIFCTCLFMASLVFCRQRSWLIAIPAALAFCAKQSTLPFVGIGILAILLLEKKGILHTVRMLLLYGLLYLGLIVLLNPFVWAHPLEAIQAAIAARQDLLTRQTHEFALASPDAVLNSPWVTGVALIANLFVIPPAIADVGNYLNQTQAAAQAYLTNPFHQLLRSLWAGGLLLGLSIAGGLIALKRSLVSSNPHRAMWALLWLTGFLQLVALALTVTLPFQRYVLPLVPFTSLWSGVCLTQLKDGVFSKRAERILKTPRLD
jgi:hypothetical protein